MNAKYMEDIVVWYFSSLFTIGKPSSMDAIIELIPTKVTRRMQDIIECQYRKDEVCNAP